MEDKLLKETKHLQNEINDIISELLKGRINKDSREAEAMYRMESLMPAIVQHLQCILDVFK